MDFILDIFKNVNSIIHLEYSPLLFLLIILLFAGSLFLLVIGLRRVESQIKKQLKALKNFDTSATIDRKNFVRAQQLFESDKVLHHQWREFEECVVIDLADSGQKEYRNTIAASEFFNFEDVVSTSDSWICNIKFNFFNVVPNLLTGLGILGTFIGIISGLEVDPNATTSVGINIDTFIVGLKKSFGTSICGLSLATAFTFFEKLRMDRTEHIVNELAKEIDRLFKRKVEQEHLINIHQKMIEQNTTLKTLASEIGENVVKSITGMGGDTVKIGDDLKEGITNGFAKLGENLNQLNEIHKTYQDSAKIILDESRYVGVAVTYLNKAVQGYSENVDDTSKKFEAASNKLEGLSEKQSEQISRFETTSTKFIQAAEISQDSIDKLIEAKKTFQDSFLKISQDLDKMVASFTSLVEEYNVNTQNSLSSTFNTFDNELSKGVTSLGKGVSEVYEGVDKLAYYLRQLKSMVDTAIKEMESKEKEGENELPPPTDS